MNMSCDPVLKAI